LASELKYTTERDIERRMNKRYQYFGVKKYVFILSQLETLSVKYGFY
jgi:hypothetical protein